MQAGQQADQGGDRRAGRRAEGQGARGRQAQRGGCGEGVDRAGVAGWGCRVARVGAYAAYCGTIGRQRKAGQQADQKPGRTNRGGRTWAER